MALFYTAKEMLSYGVHGPLSFLELGLHIFSLFFHFIGLISIQKRHRNLVKLYSAFLYFNILVTCFWGLRLAVTIGQHPNRLCRALKAQDHCSVTYLWIFYGAIMSLIMVKVWMAGVLNKLVFLESLKRKINGAVTQQIKECSL